MLSAALADSGGPTDEQRYEQYQNEYMAKHSCDCFMLDFASWKRLNP